MRLPVVVALVTTGLLAGVFAEPREQFVFRLLSVYAAGPDQALAADRDKNDKVTDTECLQSLYLFTDEKRDRRVTQAEFVDGYRRQFGLPAELLVIMFDLLDDFNDDGGSTRQGNDVTDNKNNKFFDMFSKYGRGDDMFAKNSKNRGDGILTPRDITVRKFIGESKQPSKEEYRKSLMKWVAAAADRLYSINYQPHIPGNPWDMEFDYERWFNGVDRNNDSLISFKELSDEFRRYSPDGRIKRSRWVERNLKTYRDREWLSNVVFDYWDKNKDLRLDDLDVGLILKESDRNRDMRVTTIEFHRFMEKYNKRARRRLATPVRPVMYDCPSPWWQSFGCRPRVDATRAAMDMDDNFDGWITQGELKKRVSYYDRNGDGWASRMEVMMVESMRYGVKGPVASVMFDIYDRNGDGRYDRNDVQFMLAGGRVLCFCDARRTVLDLVKLSEKFRRFPQAGGPSGSLRNAMRVQMSRQWKWRKQVERVWNKVWGEGGGPGGGCREGDCTGKDWRGGAWYSPFDWRQKNRVPENFLQWSYLRDIPRTVTFPQNFGFGGGQFPAAGRPNWWNPQWNQGGGSWGGGGNQRPAGVPGDGMAGEGFGFPRGGPANKPGSNQFPSGSRNPMSMPRNFMPNPSRMSPRPGAFPRTSNDGSFASGNFPSISHENDNSAEQFWNQLLGGLDNDTVSGWNSAWMKQNSDVQPGIGKNEQVPKTTQPTVGNTMTQDRNWQWNTKSGRPKATGLGNNGERSETKPIFSPYPGTNQPKDSAIGGGGFQGSGYRRGGTLSNRGRQRPMQGGPRFKRDVTTHSQATVSPIPSPPSSSKQTHTAENVNIIANATDSEKNSTHQSDGDQSNMPDSMKGNVTQTKGENKTETMSKNTTADDKIGRSLGWFRTMYTNNWWNYAKNLRNCDNDDPWITLNEDDPNLRDWEPQKMWQLPEMVGHWTSPGNLPMLWPRNSQNFPFTDDINAFSSWVPKSFPQWWWSGARQNFPMAPGSHVPDISNPYLYSGQHSIVKRSPDRAEPSADVDIVGKWMGGSYDSFPLNGWNSFNNRFNGYNNGFNAYLHRPQWWNMANNFHQWSRGNVWNPNQMWKNHGGQSSFFQTSPNNQGFNVPTNGHHSLFKRSVNDENRPDDDKEVRRWMGAGSYGAPSPSAWTSNWGYNNGVPYRSPRPQWWNMWNSYQSWPSRNGWIPNQMWGTFNSQDSLFPNENNFLSAGWAGGLQNRGGSHHYINKRSTNDSAVTKTDTDILARWMGQGNPGSFSPNHWDQYNGYGSTPQWWNGQSGHSFWPGHGNNNNQMWRSYYGRYYQYYPFYFSNSQTAPTERQREKRDADDSVEKDRETSTMMMPGPGGYWPQWWYMWNSFRYWPGYWNNWMWGNYFPFYYAKHGNQNTDKKRVVSKRSIEEQEQPSVSRMMGGYGGHWPQSWNMWNYNRYWPWYWNNNWMWNDHYPFHFSKNENQENVDREHVLAKRDADDSDEDSISRMMGGYGGYWPQWWNRWNYNRYWPGYWNNNWMWNNYGNFYRYYPFFYSKADSSMNQPVRAKRSTDDSADGEEVSRMMGGYGGYWPHWWNMWNYNIYWPGYWNNNWMWNNYGNFYRYYPFLFSQTNPSANQPIRTKRSSTEDEEVSRMMEGYGHHWPQSWNMWNYNRQWPGFWNYYWSARNNWNNPNWMWNRNYRFSFAEDGNNYTKEHVVNKRNAVKGDEQLSRMMRGYGVHWPQWGNMWSYNRYWPGYWNNIWMWNNHYPFYFSKDDHQEKPQKEHAMTKRSSNTQDKEVTSRMMGSYSSYWPQWWYMWTFRHMNNWYNNPMWNNYGNFYNYYPFYFSKDDDSENEHVRLRRNAGKFSSAPPSGMMTYYSGFWPFRERIKRDTEDMNAPDNKVSRMMGSYGGYWSPWWSQRQWPWYWNNWNWRWNNHRRYQYYPFFFSKGPSSIDQQARMKRSPGDQVRNQMSRMVGGYWPHMWSMWNRPSYWHNYWMGMSNGWNYPFFAKRDLQTNDKARVHIINKRETAPRIQNDQAAGMTGDWNSQHNWNDGQHNMWNNQRQWPQWMWNFFNRFFPYHSQQEQREMAANREHAVTKRSTDKQNGVSRMMMGSHDLWPYMSNMWSNSYYPSMWNSPNWAWTRFNKPYFFTEKDQQPDDRQHIISKRNSNIRDKDTISRMMGWYDGYWPWWWNMGYNRFWPWNSNNWMWNNYRNLNRYYPFFFSKSDGSGGQQVRAKRNVHDAETSRMMGWYRSNWPQWWNIWNRNRNWPRNWNNYWMWKNFYRPFYFSIDDDGKTSAKEPLISKRSIKENSDEKVSRMMRDFNGYWPQWWNMGNYNRYSPGRRNNNWMWNNYGNRYWSGQWDKQYWSNYHRPYYFSQDEKQQTPDKVHVMSKRSVNDEMSRMMGGYGRHWPHWWNMWNYNRYWPGYWNNKWMWNNYGNFYRYYPFFYSKADSSMNQPVRAKRSTDDSAEGEKVSRMMGGYGGYWPHWWNMWNYNRYWPGYWKNNWLWNNHYPFHFSKDNSETYAEKQHIMSKRSTDESNKDSISRMMGGYGGHWPHWWNMWNYNRYWPWYWNNNWMWNNHYLFHFSKNGNQENVDREHVLAKRDADDSDEDSISRMMGGYGGYWPQWWNMWNYNRYWPGYWNNYWMWNNHYPFHFSKDNSETYVENEHIMSKRSTDEPHTDSISRMMGGYGGYWPQWWNMWNYDRYWPGYWNNKWMWNNYGNYYPFFYSKADSSMNQPVRAKRSTDNSTDGEEVSRMMGGYGGYWPHWWNTWNYNRYWPGYWNNNWMWNNHYPFHFSKNRNQENVDREHVLAKRDADDLDEDSISRMMGGYGGYWPQWWNMWNYNRYWPWYWNNNWMWNNYGNFYRYYPFFYSKADSSMNQPVRAKRSTDDSAEGEKVSRMMGGYGGYWPHWWNMWNYNRYWPGYWNNNWLWNNHYPFHFSKDNSETYAEKQHIMSKRSTDESNKDSISRMMGGYGGHWPHWWNMWNYNRYWPGYWNNNWMRNNHYPFHFSKNRNQENVDREHVLAKRDADDLDEDSISRMMGGYGGYWPQWWNMWNCNKYWPGYWNNYWMWNNHYPFHFSKDNSETYVENEHVMSKRSTDEPHTDSISRMMGGYGGYWPQWWNMWNYDRYWPWYWNNNWMWNNYGNYYPFFYSKADSSMNQPVRAKRSTDNSTDGEEVSRMMGGYGGYWPYWWNMWNYNRYWPGYWNNNWMWNNHYPFHFSKNRNQENVDREHVLAKRDADDLDEDSISRMMGGYGGYWPQWWNRWNYNRYWPGYWNNNWMWNNYGNFYRYYPFFYSKADSSMNQPVRAKRSTDDSAEGEKVSRMMGGYGGYWPHWWNRWNYNRYWPGYWNNNWMWNSHYPFHFSKDEVHKDADKEHVMSKRSTELDKDSVFQMIAGPDGFWPQRWNSYNHWPGQGWNEMWNNYCPFQSSAHRDQEHKEHILEHKDSFLSKRSASDQDDKVSRMMAGYGRHWPYWWSIGNRWPNYWPRLNLWNSHNWMQNGNNHFRFSTDRKQQLGKEHLLKKRNTDDEEEDERVSNMMGEYGGFRPLGWNAWKDNQMWSHRCNNNNHNPFYFSHDRKSEQKKEKVRSKRSLDDDNKKPVSRMMGGHGQYWPQWWNTWNIHPFQPQFSNNNRNWLNNMNWNNWMPGRNRHNFPFSANIFSPKIPYEYDHNVAKREAQEKAMDGSEKEGRISHMMGPYTDLYRPERWSNNGYESGYRDIGHWWNGNSGWMWSPYDRHYPYTSFFNQLSSWGQNPGVDNRYQHQMWDPRRHMPFPNVVYSFAFSKGADATSQSDDSDLKEHREKRSADSPDGEETTETKPDMTHTTTSNNTTSKPEPDVARQMNDYSDSPGNMYQQQWLRLYKSYLNSMPTYWSERPFITIYDPSDSSYGRRYSNRYKRYYYVHYIMPFRAYRLWRRPVWTNRRWNRNGVWSRDNYYPKWTYYAALYSPFSYSWSYSMPDQYASSRQKKQRNETPTQGNTEAQEITGSHKKQQKSKRSVENIMYPRRFPYEAGQMPQKYKNFYNRWPYWWADGMSDFNNWPWWNFYTYNPMWSRRRWNNWMWSGYDEHPFRSSKKDGTFDEKTAEQLDQTNTVEDMNKDQAVSSTVRARRAAHDQTEHDRVKADRVSKWLDIPDLDYKPGIQAQNGWSNPMPGWMGGQSVSGFNNFHPTPSDIHHWGKHSMRGMGRNDWFGNMDQQSVWNSMGIFNPFSYSKSEGDEDLESSRRHERSAENLQVESTPKVSRLMSGYSMPSMSMPMYPWTQNMNQGWQHTGYNSRRQWMIWNRWGEGQAWNNWNSVYSSSFPSFSHAFSQDDAPQSTVKIRQKRSSSDDSSDDKIGFASRPGAGPIVPQMFRGFGQFGDPPRGMNNLRSQFFNKLRWGPYNRPTFNYQNYIPWWSSWNRMNQYQYGPQWCNQNRFCPTWNKYQNTPPAYWGNGGQMQNSWKDQKSLSDKANLFNNEYVDESIFDPLSSFYFSKKDASSDNVADKRLEKNTDKGSQADKKLEKSTVKKTGSSEDKEGVEAQKESRSKRNVLTRLLSKGSTEPERYHSHVSNMLKPNRRFSKPSPPNKIKRFSPEVTARLQERFQKRSAASPPGDSADETKNAGAEIAPKMAMRATAPARGQSTMDREWGPSRGAGFPVNPSSDPRIPNRNDLPDPGMRLPSRNGLPLPGVNPDSIPSQSPEPGQPLSPYTNNGGPEDWDWDDPSWNGNPNWFGLPDPGLTADGQDPEYRGGDGAGTGPQDSSSDNTPDDTANNADSQDKADDIPGSSILNGDPQNKLSNYNYIDFNNPDFWNHFYNPSSFNSSAGGPMGNSTQWNNWFGLWAYGPNFWDDMNDMDLWDAPWASGSWVVGPGGEEWGPSWWLDPEAGYSSLPVEMGWGSYWLDDCDDGYVCSGRPRWLIPDRSADEGCRSCFRPYSPAFRRYLDASRPWRYFLGPVVSPFTLRHIRPSARGSPGSPWILGFPAQLGHWDTKARWSGFPWWGWNANSFWNPWRYRIQYRSNLDNKVRRARRSDPSSVNTLGSTAATVIKGVPTSSTINKKRGPINNPSIPSPFNNQGLVAPSLFPSFPNPSMVAPFNNNGAGGWSLTNNPIGAGGKPNSVGSEWSGLPWWDKNNWHVANHQDNFRGFPDRPDLGGTGNIFSGIPGTRRLPTQFGQGGALGHWGPRSSPFAGPAGFKRPVVPWHSSNIFRPPPRGFNRGPLYQEDGTSAGDYEGVRAQGRHSQSREAMDAHNGVTPPSPWNPSPWNKHYGRTDDDAKSKTDKSQKGYSHKGRALGNDN